MDRISDEEILAARTAFAIGQRVFSTREQRVVFTQREREQFATASAEKTRGLVSEKVKAFAPALLECQVGSKVEIKIQSFTLRMILDFPTRWLCISVVNGRMVCEPELERVAKETLSSLREQR